MLANAWVEARAFVDRISTEGAVGRFAADCSRDMARRTVSICDDGICAHVMDVAESIARLDRFSISDSADAIATLLVIRAYSRAVERMLG